MNIPLLSVFLAFLLIYLPKVVMAKGQATQPGGYDNNHPRDQQAKLEGAARRAAAAHANGFEGFAPFAAAVICAHLAQVDADTLSALSLTYVASRLLYVGLYLGDIAIARSIVWTLGSCITGA